MEHLIRRCKHCQKEYTYCTYGNGHKYGTEDGCSMEYCAECQKAINDALGKIPVKFEGRFQSINEPRLFPLFDKIREDSVKDSYFNLGGITKVYCCGDYDNCDTYTHNGVKFNVEYNDDTPNDKHISVEMEYDLIEKKFTGNPWKEEYKDSYIHGRNAARDLKRKLGEIKEIDVNPMSPPTGLPFFNDVLWDVVPPNKEVPNKDSQKPKENKLHSYKIHANGAHIKFDCKNGWGCEHKRVVLENIDENSLIDFLEYEYVVEYYEDEDIVYYTDMHCI